MMTRLSSLGGVRPDDVSELTALLEAGSLSFVFGTDRRTGAHSCTRLREAAPLLLLDEGDREMTDLAAALVLQLCVANSEEQLRLAILESRPELARLFGFHPHTRIVASGAGKVAASLQTLADDLLRRESEHTADRPWLVLLKDDPAIWQQQLAWQALTALVMRGAMSGLFLLLFSSRPAYWNDALRQPFRSVLTFAAPPQAYDPSLSLVLDRTLVVEADSAAGGEGGCFSLQGAPGCEDSHLLLSPTFGVPSLLLLLDGSETRQVEASGQRLAS